jgi:hypothetical protein
MHPGWLLYIGYLVAIAIAIRIVVRIEPDTPRGTHWHRAVLIALCVLPVWPYAVIETQTALFGAMLRPATVRTLNELGFSPEIHRMKIMQLTPWRASIYTVTPCLESDKRGVTFELERHNGQWQYRARSWDAIWSDCGSADGSTFPPYP